MPRTVRDMIDVTLDPEEHRAEQVQLEAVAEGSGPS
jgi:hypothetical protein